MKRSIVAALAAAAAPLTLAQSPEDPAVIVTATRFPDSVLAAPVGVTVITSEDIRNSTATSVSTSSEAYIRASIFSVRRTCRSISVASA